MKVLPTSKDQILEEAVTLLKNNPQGLRYSELVKKITELLFTVPTNTVHGIVWNLDARLPEKVYKPARGLFRLIEFREVGEEPKKEEVIPQHEVKREHEFYAPLADYLMHDAEECTKAMPVGKSYFRDKWGTPDVIGVDRPHQTDLVKYEPIIVSAEVKVEGMDPVVAFGQACAYMAFSHKTYLAIPQQTRQEDYDRLENLCLTLGVGLITFDQTTPQAPLFEIKLKAVRKQPEMRYVNEYLKKHPTIEKELF